MTEFLFQLLGWTLNAMIAGYIAIWFYKRREAKKDQKFLKELHVKYPGLPVMYFYSLQATSDEALMDLRAQIHEHIAQQPQDLRYKKAPPPPPPPPKPDPLT